MIYVGVDVLDLDDVGIEPLVSELGFDAEFAEQLVAASTEEAKIIAAESKQSQAESLLKEETEAVEKGREGVNNLGMEEN